MNTFSFLLTSLVDKYTLWGVFLLMTLESVFIPIPSEITMPFAGFLVGRGTVGYWQVVTIGATANLTGSLFAYFLGYKMGDKWVWKAINKWGKYLLINKTEYAKSKKWFVKHGQATAFFSRLLPVIRTYISLPAGIAKADIKLFSLLTFVGSFIWSAVLVYAGVALGDNWQEIEPFFKRFQMVVVLAVVLAVIWYLTKKRRFK